MEMVGNSGRRWLLLLKTARQNLPQEKTCSSVMGSQHPSPNVKTLCNFQPQTWLEIITSRDAKSACFQGSRMSCDLIILGVFWGKFWPEKIASRDGCFLLILPRNVALQPCLCKERQFGRRSVGQFYRGQLRVKSCHEGMGSLLLLRGI